MHKLPAYIIRHFYWLLLCLLYQSEVYAINIVTSIKPIHSIVSYVMQGIAEPVLLIDKQTSAHHYQIKPNDRLAIAKADYIFWVGPDIETAFAATFSQNKKVSSLLSIKQLTTHAIRETHAHHDHDDNIDPHIWLDTNNAIIIATYIADKLGELDSRNATRYTKNADDFAARMKQLNASLYIQYASIKNKPFATLHDAFQYIEKQNDLNHITNISLHPTLPLSGKQRLSIYTTVTENKIRCIFYDPAHHTKAAQQLAGQQNIQLQALDPMGYRLGKGQDLYFNLLKNLADDIKTCLQL